MTDEETQALVDALMAGRPVELDDAGAAELAQALAAQVDRGADARAEVGKRQRLPVVCSVGCNGCCEELVLVYRPEAIAAARWLLEPAQQAVRERFLAAYPAWRKAVGDAPRHLAVLRARGDEAKFLTAHRAQWRKRVMCAFNHEGSCTIYPVRPIACRNAHAVETHTRCSGANTSDRPAARLAFPPLDQYLEQADAILFAAHQALGGDRRAAALCDAVYALVSRET